LQFGVQIASSLTSDLRPLFWVASILSAERKSLSISLPVLLVFLFLPKDIMTIIANQVGAIAEPGIVF